MASSGSHSMRIAPIIRAPRFCRLSRLQSFVTGRSGFKSWHFGLARAATRFGIAISDQPSRSEYAVERSRARAQAQPWLLPPRRNLCLEHYCGSSCQNQCGLLRGRSQKSSGRESDNMPDYQSLNSHTEGLPTNQRSPEGQPTDRSKRMCAGRMEVRCASQDRMRIQVARPGIADD